MNDMNSIVENWCNANKAHSWEGQCGTRNLENLVYDLDSNYTDINAFLLDNPGAIEAVVEWIQTQNSAEWKENMIASS